MIVFPDSGLFGGAARITEILRRHGYMALLVGGAVRDIMQGKPLKDIDIVTSALPDQVQAIFPHTFAVGAAFGIVVVVVDGVNYEVATFREERDYLDGRHPETVCFTDSPLLDASRRDFTVNAMFYDPATGEVLDFFDGQGDLSRGVIRTVGEAETRFREDYLRMLRAVRFASRFQFKLDPAIVAAITKLKDQVSRLSPERIRDELCGMLTGPNPAGAVIMLRDLGLLRVILPEVAAMDGVAQHELYHPEGDVFTHTMLMLRHMSLPKLELAWCVLLHDIGKVVTRTVGEDGIPHFYGHEDIGADMAAGVLQRLRFSRQQTEDIVHAVRNHMRFAHVDQMRASTRKRMMSEPCFPLELELHRIDCVSSNMLLGNYVLLLDKMPELEAERALPPPLLTGKDLIAMGIRPGPDMGELLRQVRDMQLEGELTDRAAAMAWVEARRA